MTSYTQTYNALPEYTDADSTIMIVFFIAIAIIIFVYLFYAKLIGPFREKKRYIKIELERAYTEREYLHWKRELKHLYMSYIPIYGRLFRKYFR